MNELLRVGKLACSFFLCVFLCEIFVFCEKICNFAKRKIKTSWE